MSVLDICDDMIRQVWQLSRLPAANEKRDVLAFDQSEAELLTYGAVYTGHRIMPRLSHSDTRNIDQSRSNLWCSDLMISISKLWCSDLMISISKLWVGGMVTRDTWVLRVEYRNILRSWGDLFIIFYEKLGHKVMIYCIKLSQGRCVPYLPYIAWH